MLSSLIEFMFVGQRRQNTTEENIRKNANIIITMFIMDMTYAKFESTIESLL